MLFEIVQKCSPFNFRVATRVVFLLLGSSSCGNSGQNAPPSMPADVSAATSDPLPAPPASGVPQPSADVTSPNLQVLPWAGFGAAISYTFDDSQPSQLEHWPELEATGVPMTFFVNPSNNYQPGYDAFWTGVAESGSEVANHTWNHCYANLSDCTPVGSAEDEIEQTSSYIREHFAVPDVYTFAAPFGDAGWKPLAASRFLASRGVLGGLVAASGPADWHDLPVIGVSANQTAAEFNAGIDRARTQRAWGIFLFHSIRPTTHDWYAGVEIADITASVEYALGLKDVWIDSMVAIAAYLRAQQLFAEFDENAAAWTWSVPAHFPPHKLIRVKIDGGTLSQNGTPLVWDSHGYYEVSLDAGTLSWSP